MKEKFIKFMEGRYGVDGFARFTMGVALVCIVWLPSFIHIFVCFPETFRNAMRKIRNIFP